MKLSPLLIYCAFLLTACGPSKTEISAVESLRNKQAELDSVGKELVSVRAELKLANEKLNSCETEVKTLKESVRLLEEKVRREKDVVARFAQLAEKMLLETSRLSELTRQGVNSEEFSRQLASASGSYRLMKLSWPSEISAEIQPIFDRAFEGWTLANDLWSTKNNRSDRPTEPSINQYDLIMAYLRDNAIVETYKQDFVVVEYVGKKYLPFDENIAALFRMASASFDAGRVELVKAISK